MRFLLIIFSAFNFSFYARADVCPKGMFWVKSHHRSAYVREDEVAFSAAHVVGHCRSKSKAYEYWADLIKEGLPKDWYYKLEKPRSWSRQDIEKLINILERVPMGLWKKVGIYRLINSITKGNSGTSMSGIIALYDLAFKSDEHLMKVLVHELAHEEYRSFSQFQKTAYNVASGWQVEYSPSGDSILSSISGGKIIGDDGHAGPWEHFANSMEMFITDPSRLKFKSPMLYDWFVIEYGNKLKK